MKPMTRHTAMLVLTVLMTSCAVFGVPPPETFNQRVSFALSNVTAVRESATEAVSSGSISADDAQNVQNQANTAREGIDIAVSIHATNPAQADQRLVAAQAVVDALKAYVSKQVKK